MAVIKGKGKTIRVAGSSTNKKPKKAKITSITIRENRGKDLSPSWDGHESMPASEFLRHFHSSMQYYNLLLNVKDLKAAVIEWMTINEFTDSLVDAFKKSPDWKTSTTMGSLSRCFLKGMPRQRDDFNEGRCMHTWLSTAIQTVVDSIYEAETAIAEIVKPVTNVISIQARVREATYPMTMEIEEAIEVWMTSPDAFDPKQFKILNLLKGKEAKPAHARIIKEYYASGLAELTELTSNPVDEDLKEGYSHRTKKQVTNLLSFYKEIEAACSMLLEEAKVTRKPRVKKAVPKDKIVEKLKYLKIFEPLKLVSVNPTDILGAKELWIYNIKTRKLGQYITDDLNGPLSIKGTSIVGFDEHKSVQKTIRKPDEKLKEFKTAGKISLRKFLSEINATDTKLNGRINEEIILLKVVS